MVYGASYRFMVAAGRTTDDERKVGCCRFLDVVPKAHGDGAVPEQDSVGAVSCLVKQLLGDR